MLSCYIGTLTGSFTREAGENGLEQVMTHKESTNRTDSDAPDHPAGDGGEAGLHLGKNGIFLVGQYNCGVHCIAYGITGSAFLRSYGVTLNYRRVLF